MPRDFNDLPDELVVKAATESLTRPDNFSYGYAGRDDSLFVTWGLTIGQHRDSEALDRSNYRRILEDMRAEFPDDIGELASSHWAVGWMEQMTIRVLTRELADDAEITAADVTPAFRKILGITLGLAEDYPVYDESDFSALESEENHEAFDSEWDSMIGHWDTDDDGPEPTGDEKDAVYERLNSEEYPRGYWRDGLAEEVQKIRAGEDG